MTKKAAWMIGLGSSGVLGYALWRRWMRTVEAGVSSFDDRMVDEAAEDSFPASDAPSHTPTTGSSIAY